MNDGQSEDVLSPMDEELEALDNDTKEDDGFSDEFEDNVHKIALCCGPELSVIQYDRSSIGSCKLVC